MVDCPGDTISYRCTIMSDNDTIELTWRVTLPGMMPINIAYDNILDIPDATDTDLVTGITATLTNSTDEGYIESVIMFTVFGDVELNGTELECIADELDDDYTEVLVNTPGA